MKQIKKKHVILQLAMGNLCPPYIIPCKSFRLILLASHSHPVGRGVESQEWDIKAI